MITRSLHQPAGPGAMGDSAPDSHVAHLNQARNTPQGRNLSNHRATIARFPNNISAPSMSMPSVEGMVDLPTLAKIFEVLSASQDNDDKDLASWIKANYLPHDFDGVIEDGGVAIKNTEGFAKLYNAYKRVRNLTNRAQDKWPFFDRRWKSMTSAQVTKMATSNDATSPSVATTALPLESSSVHESGDDDSAASAVQPQTRGSSIALDQKAGEEALVAETIKPDVTPSPTTPTEPVKKLPTPSLATVASSKTQSHLSESNGAATGISATSKSASELAAESAPEHSNLDNLPTSSGSKRKRSPDFDERGLFARGHGNLRHKRGRRGGKVGRPRGKKSLATERANLTDEVNDHTPSTFDNIVSGNDDDTEMADAPVKKPKAAAPSPRVTRRQTRLSGGSDNQDTTASAQVGLQNTGSPKSHTGSDTTAVDDEENTDAPQADKGAAVPDEDTVIPDNNSASSNLTDTELLALGISYSEKPKPEPAESMAKFEQDIGKLDSTVDSLEKTVGQDVQSQEPGKVDYFARVNTGTASFDISLDGIIDDDKKRNSDLLGYVAWREKMGEKSASVSFDTWLSIFSFGR